MSLALVPLGKDWTLPPIGLAIAVAVSATPILVLQMQLIQLLKSPVTVAVLAVFHDLAIVLYFVYMGGESFSKAQAIGYTVETSETFERRKVLTVAFPAFEGGDEVMTEVEDLITEELVPAGPETQWTGLWRVSYAPHIRTLGSLGLTKFDVYYDILPCEKGETSPKIRSYVRFEGPFWRGWLNSSGVISTLSEKEVQVDFQNFWVDWNTAQPRQDGRDIFSGLAQSFFFLELSRFPVLSLDMEQGTTVFRFPALGVQIAACLVGPSFSCGCCDVQLCQVSLFAVGGAGPFRLQLLH
eukprot:symbB.v1.2.010325.t1/scaffold671.1/size323421/6